MNNHYKSICFRTSVILALTLLTFQAFRAQVSSLDGTAWTTGVVGVPSDEIGAITTISRGYEFGARSVKSTFFKVKSYAISPTVCDTEYTMELDYDGVMRSKPKMVCKPGPVRLPVSDSEVISGTYRIDGKSITLDFSTHSISGSFDGGSYTGLLTNKVTGDVEAWKISRVGTEGVRDKSASGGYRESNKPVPIVAEPLSEALKQKYRPRELTSNTVAGQLTTQRNFYDADWYSFWAKKGVITVTVGLQETTGRYPGATLHVGVAKEALQMHLGLGNVSVNVSPGETKSETFSIENDRERQLMLRVTGSSINLSRYSIRIEGSIDLNHGKNADDALTQEQQIPSPRPSTYSATANSDWDFRLNIDRMVGKDGQIRNELHSFGWNIHLDVDGDNVTGKLLSGTGDRGEAVCTNGDISGKVGAGRLEFTVTYKGSCCSQGQMYFFGTFSSDRKTITGMLMPSRASDSYSCSLAYANVIATKRQ